MDEFQGYISSHVKGRQDKKLNFDKKSEDSNVCEEYYREKETRTHKGVGKEKIMSK